MARNWFVWSNRRTRISRRRRSVPNFVPAQVQLLESRILLTAASFDSFEENAYAANSDLETEAYAVDRILELRYLGSYYENWGGAGEKWMKGSGNQWYFITSDGNFYHWTGSSGSSFVSGSRQLVTLDSTYHADPTKLHSALAPTSPATEALEQQAYRADQLLGLSTNGNYYENWGGAGEKWMKGVGNQWFFITSDGDFYRWTGASGSNFVSGSAHLGTLDSSYHADPSKLHDAPEPTGGAPTTETLPEKAYRLDQTYGLTSSGNYSEGWGGAGEKWMKGSGNQWYFITSDGSFYRWTGASPGANFLSGSTLIDSLDGTYHADPTKLHDAIDPSVSNSETLPEKAERIDHTYDLSFSGNYYENWGGANEKWMKGSGNRWYFITSDGSFYRWTGTSPGANFLSGSTLIDSLDSTYHTDPSKLHDAYVVQSTDLPKIQFVVNYVDSAGEGFFDSTLGATRRAALEYSLSVWSNILVAAYDGETITIDAKMDPLGGSSSSATLAHAGPQYIHRNISGGTSDTWYGDALANHLAGYDLVSSAAEMTITFNTDVDNSTVLGDYDWYYGTDGQGGSDFDFVTVALHEIGHGLNFLDLINSDGSWFAGGTAGIYDRLLEDASGTALDTMTDAQRADAITSGDLYWKGSNAISANGGTRPELFAPGTLSPGSSVSHLDEGVHGDEMMSPYYSGVDHAPSLMEQMMLLDMGWDIAGYSSSSTAQTDGQTGSTDGSTAGSYVRSLLQHDHDHEFTLEHDHHDDVHRHDETEAFASAFTTSNLRTSGGTTTAALSTLTTATGRQTTRLIDTSTLETSISTDSDTAEIDVESVVKDLTGETVAESKLRRESKVDEFASEWAKLEEFFNTYDGELLEQFRIA